MPALLQAMVNNSLIQLRGPFRSSLPAIARAEKAGQVHEISRHVGRVPHTPHYFVGLLLRRSLFRTGYRSIGGPPYSGFPFLQRTEPSEALGRTADAPGNSKSSTTCGGRRQKTCFPGNLDRTEGTCLESAMDLLIPRPS